MSDRRRSEALGVGWEPGGTPATCARSAQARQGITRAAGTTHIAPGAGRAGIRQWWALAQGWWQVGCRPTPARRAQWGAPGGAGGCGGGGGLDLALLQGASEGRRHSGVALLCRQGRPCARPSNGGSITAWAGADRGHMRRFASSRTGGAARSSARGAHSSSGALRPWQHSPGLPGIAGSLCRPCTAPPPAGSVSRP